MICKNKRFMNPKATKIVNSKYAECMFTSKRDSPYPMFNKKFLGKTSQCLKGAGVKLNVYG